jgi:AcrR family transcriptional regulator
MARTINPEEYAAKRNEILDIAAQFIYTRGYEQFSIRDVIDQLQISKGAFYHYFSSKQELIEALIERMQAEGEQILQHVVADTSTPTLIKLQQFFESIGRWKIEHKDYLLVMLKVWYADDNALVRQKVQANMIKHVAPLLTAIVEQGIAEGVLTTPYPDQAGAIALSVLLGLGEAFVTIMHASEPTEIRVVQAERLVAAYEHALEQVLGAPLGSFSLIDPSSLRQWLEPSQSPVSLA